MAEEGTPENIEFEDLLSLANREVQMILRETDVKDLALALTHTVEALQKCILSNLSERVRAALREEMSLTSGAKDEEIQIARRRITQNMRRLRDSGLITWPPLKDFPITAPSPGDVPRTTRRSAADAKAKKGNPVLSILGAVGGVVVVAALLMWLSQLQTKPKISAKKSAKISFGMGSDKEKQQTPDRRSGKRSGSKAESGGASSGVTDAEGEVCVTYQGSKKRASDAPLKAGDCVETGEDGRAKVDLPDGAGQVEMEANSSVELGGEEGAAGAPFALYVRAGNILIRAENSSLEVRSPILSAIASEGAEYRFRVVLDATTTISVYEGTVWTTALVEAEEERLVLGPGEEVRFSPKGQVRFRRHDVIENLE